MKRYFQFATLLLFLAIASTAFAQTAVIEPLAVSHQDIHDGMIDTTKYHSPYTGLTVVGEGAIVYLTGSDAGNGEVTSYNWSLTGPQGSTAAIDGSEGNFASFRPDMQGKYNVGLEITTADGTHDTTLTIVSAHFVGVGTIGGTTPNVAEGQCGLCHAEQTNTWAETGHADFFIRAISGEASDHYNFGCIDCHTVGYDTDPEAVNGGFDDVMAETGWTFPETLSPDVWTDMVNNYPDLAAKTNIQCESCHGPGSQHKGAPNTMDVSLDAATCGYCHDEEPYHVKNEQWQNSGHSVGTAYATGRSGCADCHSAYGFINKTDEFVFVDQKVGHPQVSCAVCHDPHVNEGHAQLRSVGTVELANGEDITFGGEGQLCMSCHHGRRDADTYVQQYSSHFGPHYSNQADMLAGANAIEYGVEIVGTNHKGVIANSCVTCHMSPTAEGDAMHQVGEHSFKMVWDNGTPDDPSDDVDNVSGCVNCHGPIDSFTDIRAKQDYDMDGTRESVMEEVHGLLDNLGVLLPPLGDPHVEVTADYTPKQLKAAFNYMFIEEDRSFGMHNAQYSIEILNLAIEDLGGSTYVPEEEDGNMPVAFNLNQNYPNPFNPTTNISFSIPEASNVKLTVYNALGQEVNVLVNGNMNPGYHEVTFNASNLSSGVYYYEVTADNFRQVKKMMLLK